MEALKINTQDRYHYFNKETNYPSPRKQYPGIEHLIPKNSLELTAEERPIFQQFHCENEPLHFPRDLLLVGCGHYYSDVGR